MRPTRTPAHLATGSRRRGTIHAIPTAPAPARASRERVQSPSPRGAPTDHAIAVELRYFAAAAEAAGRPEERLELPAGTTLAALREQLAGRGLEMSRIIGISSCLVNALSTPTDSLTPLKDGDRIDILPPFAGG